MRIILIIYCINLGSERERRPGERGDSSGSVITVILRGSNIPDIISPSIYTELHVLVGGGGDAGVGLHCSSYESERERERNVLCSVRDTTCSEPGSLIREDW